VNVVRRRLREFYARFLSLQGDPHRLALGVAIGVFVGTTPTIPFHTVLVLGIVTLFRQHLAAAYLGSWFISNPLTIPVLYLSQYEAGRLLLGSQRHVLVLHDYSLSSIACLGWHILIPLQVGGLLFAPVFAVAAYFLTRRLLASRTEGQP
jgi:uncharacterized protein (DUF2062 family)